MVVIYCYLETDHDKNIKFYISNSSYFRNTRLPLTNLREFVKIIEMKTVQITP